MRCPSGGGFSGGPFHSQNPETSFAHIPGLKIVCPSTPADAKGLLIEAIRDQNPVLYFEHKHLYRRIKDEVPEGDYTVAVRRGARAPRRGDDLTVVTWGAMVHTADEAADQAWPRGRHRRPRCIDLRTIIPWDREAVLASVARTGKALVLHEDTRTAGFGAEIAATIGEESLREPRRARGAPRPRRTRRCRSRRRSSSASSPRSTTSWPPIEQALRLLIAGRNP